MPDDWEHISRDFVAYLRSKGRSQATAHTYAYNVALFWRWCAERETDARDVDRTIVRYWVGDRLDHVSSAKVHNDLAALKTFFAMLVEDRYREDDPTAGVTVKRTQVLPTEPLAVSEFQRLLDACTNNRDRALIMIMGYSGLRIAEVAAMTAEDIDWQQALITVRHGKGDKARRVAVNPEILGWLRSFLGMFPEGPIWRSNSRSSLGNPLAAHQLRKIIYGIGQRAGVQVHPHEVRAMYGTEMIRQHGDIQALQGQMGHASIETTARYTYWTREQRGLEQSRALNLEVAGG